jgi:adenylylsulfate kinase-like enzyme
VLLTGRVGAGKQTIGRGVLQELRSRGQPSALVDGASVEHRLGPGIDALTWLCSLLVDSGVLVLVSAPVPGRDERERFRAAVPAVVEVFVDAPADQCEARSGRADTAFEEPYAPDLRVPTYDREPSASIAQVLSDLEERDLVDRS